MIKVIIYDCDGVLIDSRRSNEAFYNHILTHFGLRPLTPEQLDVVHAATAQEAVDFLFRGTPWLTQAQDFQRRIDNAPFLALIRLEPHVREVLAQLRPGYRPPSPPTGAEACPWSSRPWAWPAFSI